MELLWHVVWHAPGTFKWLDLWCKQFLHASFDILIFPLKLIWTISRFDLTKGSRLSSLQFCQFCQWYWHCWSPYLFQVWSWVVVWETWFPTEYLRRAFDDTFDLLIVCQQEHDARLNFLDEANWVNTANGKTSLYHRIFTTCFTLRNRMTKPCLFLFLLF